jgi:hypothetical protein
LPWNANDERIGREPVPPQTTLLTWATTVALLLAATAIGACGRQSSTAHGPHERSRSVPGPSPQTTAVAVPRRISSAPVVREPRKVGRAWKTVATISGQPAAWIAQRSGVTLMRFNQGLVHLALHAGSSEPGGHGWLYGDKIGRREIHHVVAAFNGGFKLDYGSVGFMSGGRVAVRLAAGRGSIVTYRNGMTQIGAWHEGVPARALQIASVRQNLHLLVDHGVLASNTATCVQSCWGSTLGGGADVARSALGIDGEGQLVWAAGESLSPANIGTALVDAGAVRAVELDINPAWVAGYLYVHHGRGPTVVPVVPGQTGIAGQLLAPYSRDFFTVLAN